MVFVWLIVVWNVNDIMNSPAATSSKKSKKLPGGITSLLQYPLPRHRTTRTPFGPPIVICEPALGLAAAMLAAKYQK